MNLKEELEQLVASDNIKISDTYLEASVPLEELDTTFLYLYESLKFHWLKNICITDEENTFQVRYILTNPESSDVLVVKVFCSKNTVLKSVSSIWGNATSLESEAYELFGVQFDYDIERRFFANDTNVYPLLKDFKTQKIKPKKHANVGDKDLMVSISYPLKSNDANFHLKLKDDVIEKCLIDIGYHHMGLEKTFEDQNFDQILHKMKYLNYDTGIIWSLAWAMLIENGNKLEIPDKAKGLRMILVELVRIRDHLHTLIQLAYKTEYVSFFNVLVYWYNRSLDQLRNISSRNSVADFLVVGGVRDDLPVGWMSSCTQFLTLLEKKLLEEYKFFCSNSFWNERLNCGEISRTTAFKSGISGPVLRASGINHDQRKKKPFYFYDEVSFDVPLGLNGRVYDRFLVFVEEIFQSIRIINQVLDNIPAGKFICDEAQNIYQLKTADGTFDKSLLKQLVDDNPAVNFRESFISIESSNGLIDIWTRFSQANLSQRVSCSENSSKLLTLFEKDIVGEKLEDLELFWLSLGINMVEVER